MTTEKNFRITNRTSGLDLGVYAAATPDDAVAIMTADAGYSSVEQAAKALSIDVAAYVAGLQVDEA